jgi:hypothetical protein
MPIDLTEEILPFSAAAKRLPRLRNGRPVAPSTLWRWATAGMHGVKLETIKVGGSTCTSVEALARFVARLNNQPTQHLPVDQSKRQDRVEQELTARGV